MDLVNEPSSPHGDKYNVFLSFYRGDDDPEFSFPSLLHLRLKQAGISVLKGDVSIELLLGTIECSKISIVIISKHIASSRRCLKELTKIMEFRIAKGQVVVPIFYGVNRSDIRNQESNFGQAFQDFIQRASPAEDEVSMWRTALSEAGSIYGFSVRPHLNLKLQDTHNPESEVIEDIVDLVRYILDSKGLFDMDGLVGMSSQVLEVITMLRNHRSDVVSIGIWGMGGSGKTTLARLIYDHFGCHFNATCFLSNVREAWERKGENYLQKQLLSVICKGTGMTTVGVESASLMLNITPCDKKVLLVLDDADDMEQLHALCANHKWFGVGSKIIITTRDLRLLDAFQVDDIYTMKLLSDQESLHLFSRKAFNQSSPNDEGQSIELCKRIVAYSEGLPLALQVFGSYFSGRFPIEWNSALMNLITDLPPQIYYKLKFSFDSLDNVDKEIFINIVLFYIGEDKDDVIQKLPRVTFASFGIDNLVQKSLVTIDKNNKLRVHNMLQLMGRQIMRESSQNELRSRGHKYDVFLSFRGEDTRTTFTSHLYSALCNAGVIVFKDDVELSRGNYIKIELFQAIGSSKIAVIIFSKEYARSKWCLEELSMIMELHKSNNQVVFPVFYNVDPSEIRNQTSSFGEAFQDLLQIISPKEDQVSNWRSALTKVGGIAGFVVLKSRDESESVKAIVDNVCDILDKKDLFVADHPIGVDDRVQEVITMLQNHQSQDVVMVGIWGMGGIGKTTIAKAIYNAIGHTFESRSYLSKIREVWGQEKNQVSLQNQLLHEICKTTNIMITSTDSGKITLCDRLRHKTALIVLDDVDELAQLHALAGSRDWFKPGSKIFITTRNQRLLLQMDCRVYMMKNLNVGESIELFSWHAFKQESPKEDFTKLSRDIVAYSGGLPLALEVFGSYLSGREVKEWKSVLEKLKKIPNDKIQEKLKISFDGLDDLEKEILLDISCFFIGMERNEVTQILNDCGFFADIGIKTLIERSLITIDEKNTLIGMHDLLRDMGREIVRRQSQKELGKRSRLWFHEDALAVLLKHVGTEAIEGLSLKLSKSEKMCFQTEAFKTMKRLRLLHLKDVQLIGNYECISMDLKWLCWHGFPINYIPYNLYQEELVVIDLQYSSLRQVWKETRLLERLKILNLSHSPYLVQTRDFSQIPNLEKLILKDCPSLSVIHHSIELLDKLFLLDLEDCIGLHSLPRSIYRLKCLKTLILSGCVKIEKLEEDIEQMKSLTTLIAPTIKQVPISLVRLRNILYLSVHGHEGLSHHVIPSLYRSWESPTNNPLPLIPTHAGMPSSILWDMLNSIQGPSTIRNRRGRQQLLMEDGSEIEIPNSSCTSNCMDISRLESGLGHLLILIGKNSQVFHSLSKRISQGLTLTKYNDDCILPGDNLPYWLAFKDEGTAVKFEVPPPANGCDYLKGMTICSVYNPSGGMDNKAGECCIISLMIINYTKAATLVYMGDKLNSLEEVERKEIISNLESNDQMEVRAIFRNGFTGVKTIVYLIYNESFDEQMEPSQSEATILSGTKHRYQEELEAHQSTRPKPRKAMRI